MTDNERPWLSPPTDPVEMRNDLERYNEEICSLRFDLYGTTSDHPTHSNIMAIYCIMVDSLVEMLINTEALDKEEFDWRCKRQIVEMYRKLVLLRDATRFLVTDPLKDFEP